jgi:hypothetical protein
MFYGTISLLEGKNLPKLPKNWLFDVKPVWLTGISAYEHMKYSHRLDLHL